MPTEVTRHVDASHYGLVTDPSALADVVASSYEKSFARVHPWLVRKAILHATKLCTSRDAYLGALRRGNEREMDGPDGAAQLLKTCASRLQVGF